MKKLLVATLILSSFSLFAQEYVENITETDCSGNMESVDEALNNSTLPLLVIASGYDCSICRSEAPGFDIMADTLVGKARVWGAMHYRFSANDPSCANLDSWKSSYGWDNIYTFNDVNNGTSKSWAQGGYTSYTVIARDKEFLYRGTNRTTALNTFFQEINEKVTGLSEAERLGISFSYSNGSVVFNNEKALTGDIQLFDATGRMVGTLGVNNDTRAEIEVRSGINFVIAKFVSAQGEKVTQKLSW